MTDDPTPPVPGDERTAPPARGAARRGEPAPPTVADGEGDVGAPTRPPAGARLAALWRRAYGESPFHLLLHLAGIALAAWALSQAFDARYEKTAGNLLLWLVAGLVLHDLVALPLYVVGDRIARTPGGLVRWLRQRGPTMPAVGTVRGNGHVRLPLVVSGVLLLVYFPNILHKAPKGHLFATGLAEQPDYAARWLLISAGLFLLSALIYALRSARSASAAAAARRSSLR